MDSKQDPLCQLDIRMIKQYYGERFTKVSKVLSKYDPLRLRMFEVSEDEYDPEAKTIIVQLDKTKTVEELQEVVYMEFIRWFDEGLVGSKKKYLPIAKELFELRA